MLRDLSARLPEGTVMIPNNRSLSVQQPFNRLSPINCNAPLHFARGLSVTLIATSPSTERNEPGRYVVTGSVVHFGGSTERDEPGRCIVTGSDVRSYRGVRLV